jgi:hypothetical protein
MSVADFKAVLCLKSLLCANLDAQNSNIKGKDMPNLKDFKELRAVLCSVLFPEKVAYSFGFLYCDLGIWNFFVSQPLEL